MAMTIIETRGNLFARKGIQIPSSTGFVNV